MKRLVMAIAAMGIMVLGAGTALAVHEANNQFDLAATTAAFPNADGSGYSNFIAGNNGWNNKVSVTGLAPSTSYSWYGGPSTLICSFVTDAAGSGGCTSDVNSRLSTTDIRETSTNTVVLRAVDTQDEDQQVEDGEIERRGTCRESANPRCDNPGR